MRKIVYRLFDRRKVDRIEKELGVRITGFKLLRVPGQADQIIQPFYGQKNK